MGESQRNTGNRWNTSSNQTGGSEDWRTGVCGRADYMERLAERKGGADMALFIQPAILSVEKKRETTRKHRQWRQHVQV